MELRDLNGAGASEEHATTPAGVRPALMLMIEAPGGLGDPWILRQGRGRGRRWASVRQGWGEFVLAPV